MAKKVGRIKKFKAEESLKPKFYALDMFPYPSGAGLHIGHIASYTPSDIVSRFKRAQGFNVLHPMGFDSFGLPAEQFAIKTGIHPAKITEDCINNFKRQLKSFGFSYDWDREISTADPSYFKWTQFIFLKLWEKGLAYEKDVLVNWCPALRVVLANEEVVNGKSERGDHDVIRVPMRQWMLNISAYAERLLQDLDKLDWPEKTKEGQRNWIGKKVGHNIKVKILDVEIDVFSENVEALNQVAFVLLSTEHPMVSSLTSADKEEEIKQYLVEVKESSEILRKSKTVMKFLGSYVLNPLDGSKIPVYVSGSLLEDQVEFGIPSLNPRDQSLAKDHDLSYSSQILNKEDVIKSLGDKCSPCVTYRLRDWIFSRQRYWGEPIPLVHYPDKSIKAVPLNELPLLLPMVESFEPKEDGTPPLAQNHEWRKAGEGLREINTMPGTAGSSWYFLRFTDPHNDKEPFSFDHQKYWMPVDLYVGGSEHTVAHLLYARFWQKVLFDLGLVSHDEPFKKVAHQGMILGSDGQKISKSKNNMIDLDSIYNSFGADVLRTYLSFLGPLEKEKPWSESNIEGVKRFFNRIETLVLLENKQGIDENTLKLVHKSIKKVTEDIENLRFNTAISTIMILVNSLNEKNCDHNSLKICLQLLSPFAPHFCEELGEKLGLESISSLPWPQWDESKVADGFITMGVQVNGKTRGSITLDKNSSQEEAMNLALSVEAVKAQVEGKDISQVIYKPGKIFNLVLKV